ncbi:MAG: hypothetical protein WKF71_03555 [Pyrinomonadaceae bacterium]
MQVENKGGINGARLPGFFSVDFRAAYKFNFTERVNAGFTFEVFNLANRTNYDENYGFGKHFAEYFADTFGRQACRALCSSASASRFNRLTAARLECKSAGFLFSISSI